MSKPGKKQRKWAWFWLGTVFVLLCLGAVLGLAWKPSGPGPAHPGSGEVVRSVPRFIELTNMSPAEVTSLDVACVNLACAEGLPGSEGLDAGACLRTLDDWAAKVNTETERHLYRFRNSPAEYENSEAYFRMLMMAVVVYEDLGVRYNPARISSPGAAADLSFFADSRDLFLHGLCGPGHQGTCSSMPVLYAALGRRLGYPLRLVTTKAHVFLRWEDERERFNLEATGQGMNKYDDEHFKRWPFPVSEQEILEDGFLKSLSPAEELALFLSLRAQCLRVAGRPAEAAQALECAIKFAPASRPYRLLLAGMHEGASPQPAVVPLPEVYQGYAMPPASPVPDPNPLLQVR